MLPGRPPSAAARTSSWRASAAMSSTDVRGALHGAGVSWWSASPRARSLGLHWGPMYQRDLHSVRDAFRALDSLYVQRKLAPLVSRALPLERVAEALESLAAGKTVGKVVLTM